MKKDSKMVVECRHGQMAQYTRDIGRTAKLMGVEDLFIQKAMSKRWTGSMVRQTVKATTCMLMDPSMKVAGKTICNMETGMKLSLTGHATKDNTLKERSMDKASFSGKMETATSDSWLRIC